MQQRRLILLRVALAYLGFVSLGLPDGLLGVAWPSMRAFFDIPLGALGSLLVLSTAGYVLSSFSSGRILSRTNVGALLAVSCLATAAALLGYAAAPKWWIMVALASLAGLGAGAIDAGVNTYFAAHHGPRTLNWLHAFYGVGAMTGPAIMTSVLGAGLPWQRGYACVGVAQLVLAAAFGLTYRQWPGPGSEHSLEGTTPVRAAPARSTLSLPIVWVSIATFLVYTGLEASLGAWVYTLFTESRAVSMHTAAFWVSVYWASLTVGRLGFGFIVGRAPVHVLLRWCMVGIAAGAGLIWLDLSHPLDFAGLALAGLASGPIFPSLIATTPARVGQAHNASAVGFEVAAAALGQALVPGLVGLLAGSFGLWVVAPTLLAAALILLALHGPLFRADRAQEKSREPQLTMRPRETQVESQVKMRSERAQF